MARNYRERFDELLRHFNADIKLVSEIEFPGELVFVLGRDEGWGTRDEGKGNRE